MIYLAPYVRKKSLKDYFWGLPQRIRQVRGELSQKEFADLIGVNQRTVHKYEKGIASPGAFILKMIANQGAVSVEWLLRGGEGKGAELLDYVPEKYETRPAE